MIKQRLNILGSFFYPRIKCLTLLFIPCMAYEHRTPSLINTTISQILRALDGMSPKPPLRPGYWQWGWYSGHRIR